MKRFVLLMLLVGNCYAAEWECFGGWGCGFKRLQVPHGWLVTYSCYGITFYPDENHEWKL